MFRLKIQDVDHFEEKLRAVEAELGIPPSGRIPVRYQRESNFGSIIFTVGKLPPALFCFHSSLIVNDSNTSRATWISVNSLDFFMLYDDNSAVQSLLEVLSTEITYIQICFQLCSLDCCTC